MKHLWSVVAKLLPTGTVYAHCDIPCGIYDPYPAQIAAHSVIRMTKLIMDAHAEKGDESKVQMIHDITRYTKVKEDHAEIVKHEVRVIWGDYFKEEMLKDYPDLHTLVFQIMKLASKTKQGIDLASSEELLAKVQEFAEIFWKTKGKETKRIPSPYPTARELVVLA